MAKNIFSNYLKFLILTFILSGCSSNANYLKIDSLNSKNVTSTTDKVFKINNIKCDALRGKKVFASFENDQIKNDAFEDINIMTGDLIKKIYDGDINKDFETAFDRIIENHCNAIVTKNPANSDLSIKVNIKKYYSQVLDYKKSGDKTMWGMADKKMSITMSTSTVLNIDTTANNHKYYYDHLINFKNECEMIKDFIAYYVIGANVKFYNTQKFILNYDDLITIATGVVANTARMDAFIIPVTSQDISGHLDIYDPQTSNIDQKIKITTEDYDTIFTGRLNNSTKKEYIKLYGFQSGHLAILMYDYFKKTIERLNDDLSNKAYFN